MKTWDHNKPSPKTVLSDYEYNCLPYAVSSALHYTTGIPRQGCGDNSQICAMCGNAVRLVLQAAEPQIKANLLEKIARQFGFLSIDLHPRCGD